MTKVQELLIVNLKKSRSRRGFSQMKLAETAGLSLGFIGDIEAGKKFPSARTMQKIIDALGIEPYELFIDSEDDSIPYPQEKVHIIKNELVDSLEGTVSRVFSHHFDSPSGSRLSTRNK